MSSFTLTPLQLSTFSLLPGHVLIKLSPAELTTEAGLHLPEWAAEDAVLVQAMREGTIIMTNRKPMTVEGKNGKVKKTREFMYQDYAEVREKRKCLFAIHGDEVENEYVVAKFGQIWAVID